MIELLCSDRTGDRRAPWILFLLRKTVEYSSATFFREVYHLRHWLSPLIGEDVLEVACVRRYPHCLKK
jgi:hypothetical protein